MVEHCAFTFPITNDKTGMSESLNRKLLQQPQQYKICKKDLPAKSGRNKHIAYKEEILAVGDVQPKNK